MKKLILALTLSALPALSQAPAGSKAAKPVEIQPFEVAALGKGGWFGRFGMTNCSWIDMGDGVLVIDTGATVNDAANLAAQIRETTKGKPIKWLVLTHLHSDSNTGVQAFLPTDATVFVNAKVAASVAMALKGKEGQKLPTVVGVSDKIVVGVGTRVVHLGAPAGAAHTDHDLYAFSVDHRALFVGDLVTPGRCPMASDATNDPRGWLEALDRLDAANAAVVIASRGPESRLVQGEIGDTRSYLTRLIKLVTEYKNRKLPEAQVGAELAKLDPAGKYCPTQLDNINGLALFRRVTPDGKFPPAPPPPVAPGAASAPKKK